RVLAGGATDVVDLDQEARGVVHAEEPRRAHRHDHRVADEHVGFRTSHAALRPGHRREAGRAGEVGQVERDLSRAVLAYFDNAGVEGEQHRGGRRGRQARAAFVAADIECTRIALRGVDQHAVEVTQLDAELTLAEIPAGRI